MTGQPHPMDDQSQVAAHMGPNALGTAVMPSETPKAAPEDVALTPDQQDRRSFHNNSGDVTINNSPVASEGAVPLDTQLDAAAEDHQLLDKEGLPPAAQQTDDSAQAEAFLPSLPGAIEVCM